MGAVASEAAIARPTPAIAALERAEGALDLAADRRERGAAYVEPTALLFASWKAWAEAGGEYVGSTKRFSDNLTNRGFERGRDSGDRSFRGLRLLRTASPADPMQF